MPKGTNSKLKLIYLMKILTEETDEKHKLTMNDILKKLSAYGISAERKSVYDDINILNDYGMDIIKGKDNGTFGYYVGVRKFELAELKLLTDAVQSSRFITQKKTDELIRKIEGLGNIYEAKEMNRQIYVSQRVKTENETIFYSVDTLHTAIEKDKKVSFQYFQWNVDKQREFRKNGELYIVSPIALTWDYENYYLVAYDKEAEMIKHYRVDKMLSISIVNETRDDKEKYKNFDTAVFSKKVFGMFDGEEQIVSIRFANRFAGVVIDRFGKDITIFKEGKDYFKINVKIAVSMQFLGWLIALGEGVTILGPEAVIDEMRKITDRLNRDYN